MLRLPAERAAQPASGASAGAGGDVLHTLAAMLADRAPQRAAGGRAPSATEAPAAAAPLVSAARTQARDEAAASMVAGSRAGAQRIPGAAGLLRGDGGTGVLSVAQEEALLQEALALLTSEDGGGDAEAAKVAGRARDAAVARAAPRGRTLRCAPARRATRPLACSLPNAGDRPRPDAAPGRHLPAARPAQRRAPRRLGRQHAAVRHPAGVGRARAAGCAPRVGARALAAVVRARQALTSCRACSRWCPPSPL